MSAFLSKLIKQDCQLKAFSTEQEIIQQGLAPLLCLNQPSLVLQKADLLEQFKHQNWQKKASILFLKLSENNIRFLVFKGFAFTHLLYNSAHIRPYSDIDIIVEQSDYILVADILKQLGYQQYPSRQGEFVSFQNSFFDRGSPNTVFDVHWQINNRIEFHKHFHFNDLYQNAIELKTTPIAFKSLGFIDAFILGCFHYHAHRPIDRKHIWLYDLAQLWNKMDKHLQKKCLHKAKQSKQSGIVFNTLFLLQNTFDECFDFNFEIPQSQSETTNYYLQQRTNKISDIKTRIKNINGLKNKIIFISEYVFQSKQYVLNRYHLKSGSWVYFYYPRMWAEDIFKLFKKS